MEHPQANINTPNRKGHTAVHLAAIHASTDMVRLMLATGGSRLDVDSYEDATGETARQLIATKYPQLARLLPPRSEAGELTADRLFFYLYSRESGNFLSALASGDASGSAQGPALLDADDGSHTLLQLASEVGLHDVVTALLDNGADPNRTTPINRLPALHAACYHGYYRVARSLASHERTDLGARSHGETVLHAAVKGAAETTTLGLAASRAGRDHRKCVQVSPRFSVKQSHGKNTSFLFKV